VSDLEAVGSSPTEDFLFLKTEEGGLVGVLFLRARSGEYVRVRGAKARLVVYFIGHGAY